ncbi:hypothetical protein RJ640_005871 [Escallonia rubra]|uniref:SLC26A/SulP transporter domain-containing protein n=1 Tax=Escallonia rubra TaxID=112253 RepID=A0AA88RY56_9ASTE|nr:hypothetical protein RJ640_005871 [Escallonia rubra]
MGIVCSLLVSAASFELGLLVVFVLFGPEVKSALLQPYQVYMRMITGTTAVKLVTMCMDGISYAKLANLPPIVDSSFVPPLVYAVLGSSRDLAVGPVSIAHSNPVALPLTCSSKMNTTVIVNTYEC